MFTLQGFTSWTTDWVTRLGSVEDESRSRANNRHPATVQANDRDQQLATFDEPHRPILSRVCCIAWFGLGTYFEGSTGLSAVSFAASAATSALMAMIFGIKRIMVFWDNCIDFCINSGCLAKNALPAGD